TSPWCRRIWLNGWSRVRGARARDTDQDPDPCPRHLNLKVDAFFAASFKFTALGQADCASPFVPKLE
ncbi:MAG: hypothetical protein AAGF82_14915, partial [Pseudomonadota bacterium]